MKSIARLQDLEALIGRLRALEPAAQRRWGTMSPGEMLCHVGDASASILDGPRAPPKRRRTLMKFIALYTPVRWPRDLKTPAQVDPRRMGSRPGDFEVDRERAIDGLRALSQAPASALPPSHGHLGRMSRRDWQRWAYKHTDHHLRQFGL
jgi:Protein of unknown function (DUF1569)